MDAQRLAAWRAYGRALKSALTANLCVVEGAPEYRCGWMDGGCFVAARAVARLVDGELWAVETRWTSWPRWENRAPAMKAGKYMGQVEHLVVRTPDGAGFLDADGFATQRQLETRWRKYFATVRSEVTGVVIVQAPEPTLVDGDQTLVLDPENPAEIRCDVELAQETERRLRAALPAPP